jgi:cysteinyl-tRNA synthetase
MQYAVVGQKPFSTVYVHALVRDEKGKKMSKSLGNFFAVRDLLDQGIPGEVIRFVFLSTHYRKPMDWTAEKAREAEDTLSRWYVLTDGVEPEANTLFWVSDALADDLNTPSAISIMHEMARNGSAGQLKAAMQLLGFGDAEEISWFRSHSVTLGTSSAGDTPLYADQIMPFLQRWQDLRMEKRYSEADTLKNDLEATGLRISNTQHGPHADIPNDFDPDKLEALK